MIMIRRTAVAVLVLSLIGLAGYFLLLKSAAAVLIEQPRLVATNTVPGDAKVFLAIQNLGSETDYLIGAVSALEGSCGFHGPTLGQLEDGALAITVPAEGKTLLAAETAHIEITGLTEALQPGQIIPLTLIFQNAGEVPIKARVDELVAPDQMVLLSGLYEPAAGEPVPVLGVQAVPAADGRVAITLLLENFELDKATVDLPHTPGRGHAHLYIDNVKIGRMYAPTLTTEPLAPGEHLISVALNTNDHRAYAQNGEPMTASVSVTIP